MLRLCQMLSMSDMSMWWTQFRCGRKWKWNRRMNTVARLAMRTNISKTILSGSLQRKWVIGVIVPLLLHSSPSLCPSRTLNRTLGA